jgi:release factor glutamine methyltransferase
MKIGKILERGERRLGKAGISSARLDVLILLEDALHKDRAWVLAHPKHEVAEGTARRLERKIERRAGHVPLAYIRGHTEFYGRHFKVNRHVLEPRPESETMITLVQKLRLPPKAAIADVGTGNGAIGISAALEFPGTIVDLYDISAGAIAVAKHNVHLHELRLHVRKMANLPYVPEHWQINQAAMAEPKIAIFGGKDGLDVYRKLFTQLQRFTWQPKYVLTEALPPQHEALAAIAGRHGFQVKQTDDFIQVFIVQKT